MSPLDSPMVAPSASQASTDDATGAVGPVIVSTGLFPALGVIASVAIGAQQGHDLHHEEQTLVAEMSPARAATFIAGRQALRAAIGQVAPHHSATPVLRTTRGAPLLPTGLVGSISHKRTRAVAIAATATGDRIGIDLELRPTEADVQRPSIASRILTSAELEAMDGLDAHDHREATLIRFALKEAVYKAIDPYVERYVRFTEVELDVRDDGVAAVRLLLPELSVRDVTVESQWRFDGPWIIAVARSTRA